MPEKQEKKEEPEFKIEKPEFRTATTEIKKRNSNLLRNLMGHLGKAKETLEKQKPLVKFCENGVYLYIKVTTTRSGSSSS